MTGFQSKRAQAQDKLADNALINCVMDQIEDDFDKGDLTALEELLRFVPRENLIAFLKEDV